MQAIPNLWADCPNILWRLDKEDSGAHNQTNCPWARAWETGGVMKEEQVGLSCCDLIIPHKPLRREMGGVNGGWGNRVLPVLPKVLKGVRPGDCAAGIAYQITGHDRQRAPSS